MKKHVVVGLTGGFGTGKSTVARLFEELGACVIDADKLVHAALLPGSEVYSKVVRLFAGRGSVMGAKGLDRRRIAEIVFRDAGKRKQLEAILHPYVFSRMVSAMAESAKPVTVLQVPLLYETGFDQFCTVTVVVKNSEATARKRLALKGVPADEARRRWRAQMSQEEKISRAGYVIDNSKTVNQTKREVRKIWNKIIPAHKGEK